MFKSSTRVEVKPHHKPIISVWFKDVKNGFGHWMLIVELAKLPWFISMMFDKLIIRKLHAVFAKPAQPRTPIGFI